MEIFGGLVFLAAAAVFIWLGRPQTDVWIAAAIQKWRAQGSVAILATACVGMGLALVVIPTATDCY